MQFRLIKQQAIDYSTWDYPKSAIDWSHPDELTPYSGRLEHTERKINI